MPQLWFDHVGVVARDADAGVMELARMIGATEATVRFDDPVLTVSVRFVRDPSGTVFELIAPFGSPSVVDGALRKGSNIINQVAYRTRDLDAAVEALRAQGGVAVGEAKPALAFNGARVQFVMARLGFLIEVIESPDHRHVFHPLQFN